MCSGQIRYAVLGPDAHVLHTAPDDASFRPYSDFPAAVAVAVGGTANERPQLLHPLVAPPMALIRRLSGRGWRVGVHPGWR
jgi:hypothetical protein